MLEETGLIFPATEWLIKELIAYKQKTLAVQNICRKLRRLAINLSPVQLWRPDLAHRLLQHLEVISEDRVILEFELTENALLQPTRQILKTLDELKIKMLAWR